MSESKSVNNEINSRELSKELNITDILDEAKIQEVINTFCKDLSKINTLDECGWTPLYRTVIAGDIIASQILISKGANPNIQCSMGETPLYQAVDMGKLPHVKLLINSGANPNLVQDDGLSPLHSAVVRQNLLIVKYLLKNGSNPNIKSKMYNQSPVHLAIKNNVDPMILLLLVQFNGSLLDKDKFGKRPIDYICSKEMKDAIEKLKFENNPNKKMILLPLFQTPQKYKNWAISKVYSNTIRSNSPRGDINLNSNTILKDPGNLKYNIIGTNHTERYNKIINDKNKVNHKNKKHNKTKEIINIDNNDNNDATIGDNNSNKEKENFDPNFKKRKLSFNIKEESSSVVESDKGDNNTSNEIIIKKSFFINKKVYQSDTEDDKYKNNSLSNIIFSSKKKKKQQKKSENSKNLNNFYKIPKNRSYTKSVADNNHITYNIPNNNTFNNNNIIKEKEPSNYKFVQIYDNSKVRKGSFSINPENQRRIQNQTLNMNDLDSMIDKNKSKKTNNYLYTKPILGLNDLNAKKLNLSHYVRKSCSIKINEKNKNSINKNDISNSKKISINSCNTSNNKSSCNKKYNNNIKRLFTFMDNENNNNNNNSANKKQEDNNNNNDMLLNDNSNNNNNNRSRNYNNEIVSENDNNSNIDCQRKTGTISNPTTIRNNTSTYYDESSGSYNNYLWKFKNTEDDNSFHKKKMSGNTTLTTCSYNIDINQNALFPIYEWLKEIELSCYFNLFIEKKIYNLDKVIYNLKNGICNVTKKDIIKLGISKPGHIYRIITKMEIDSEKINNQISSILLGRKNINGTGEINVLKNSVVYCCGCCSVNNQSKYYCNNDMKKYQLEQWLLRIKMSRYKENFIKNGFDMFE
jgi:ankyrin repeat protein